MRVFIGPYPRDWNLYTLIRKLNLSEKNEDKVLDWFDGGRIERLFIWVNEHKPQRKIKVRIDESDVWSMDHTLAHIILPMLKKVKENKHGSPLVDDEDLPEHMRHGDPNEHDNWVHYRWDYILNEMIFAFENTVDDSWEDSFSHGNPKYEEIEVDVEQYGKGFSYKQVNPDYWFDDVGYKEYNKRIQNGYRLFGKYYSALWT
jgi:hypothetical protein